MATDEKPSESQRLRGLSPGLLLREAGQALLRDCVIASWVSRLQPITDHIEGLGIDSAPEAKAERLWTLGEKVLQILWQLDLPHLTELEVPICLSDNFDRCSERFKLVDAHAPWNEKGIADIAAQMRDLAVLLRGGTVQEGGKSRYIERRGFVKTLELLKIAFRDAAKRFDREVEMKFLKAKL